MTNTATTSPPAGGTAGGHGQAGRAVAPAAGRRARPGALLAIVLTGQLMAVIDVFIVNIGLPTIHRHLHASGASLQLVVAGYTIAYAVLLVTGARLGAILGYARMFLSGAAVFTLASLGRGLAGTVGQLIALRFAQGAGAAMMIPQVLSLIQRGFTGEARARAMTLYSAILACGALLGQIAGGLLISADVAGTAWRPLFLVNVPIGLVLLAAGMRWLPRLGGGQGRIALAGGGTLGPTPDRQRPGAPAARPGELDRRDLPGHGRVQRFPVRADPAPAGGAGRLRAAGGADVRTDRDCVRRCEPVLAPPPGPHAPRGEHRRLRRLRRGPALAGRRAARRRRRRCRAAGGADPAGGRQRGRVQPGDDQGAGAGPGGARSRRERPDRDHDPARDRDRRGGVRHAVPEPRRAAAGTRSCAGRLGAPGLGARGIGHRRGPRGSDRLRRRLGRAGRARSARGKGGSGGLTIEQPAGTAGPPGLRAGFSCLMV